MLHCLDLFPQLLVLGLCRRESLLEFDERGVDGLGVFTIRIVVACHRGHVRRQTETDPASQSIRPTAPRADVTLPEHLSRRFDSAAEFPRLQQIQV